MGGLSATHDGTPKPASASTNPAGLDVVTITYEGSTTAPSNAGSYDVVASLTNINYEAPAVTGTLVIAKAAATITLDGLAATFDGAPKNATATTSPAGIPGVAITYNGSSTAPTDAGSYAVVASLTNGNYDAPDATGSLVIAKATATITLDGLAANFDGSAKNATATTSPAGIPGVVITYDGSTTPPTNAGSYTVLASLTNANYDAPDASGTLVIGKATASIALSGLTGLYDGTPKVAGATTNPAGLSVVSVTYDGSAVAPTNAGSYAIVAALSNGNYNASNAAGTLTIARATQSITFPVLPNKTLGDAPFTVSATSSSLLAVSFTAGPNCTVSGTTVTIVSGGICTVTASQTGNGNYYPAQPVSQSFGVVYSWSDVLQPVNSDGSSVFKQGSYDTDQVPVDRGFGGGDDAGGANLRHAAEQWRARHRTRGGIDVCGRFRQHVPIRRSGRSVHLQPEHKGLVAGHMANPDRFARWGQPRNDSVAEKVEASEKAGPRGPAFSTAARVQDADGQRIAPATRL